jgi:hypothetical protein
MTASLGIARNMALYTHCLGTQLLAVPVEKEADSPHHTLQIETRMKASQVTIPISLIAAFMSCKTVPSGVVSAGRPDMGSGSCTPFGKSCELATFTTFTSTDATAEATHTDKTSRRDDVVYTVYAIAASVAVAPTSVTVRGWCAMFRDDHVLRTSFKEHNFSRSSMLLWPSTRRVVLAVCPCISSECRRMTLLATPLSEFLAIGIDA